jgi:hypothetical protein
MGRFVFMNRLIVIAIGVLCVTGLTAAQTPAFLVTNLAADSAPLLSPSPGYGSVPAADRAAPVFLTPAPLPRMAPELALQTFERRSSLQAMDLAAYSATTVIHAELPDTFQFGEYELQRHYAAPRTLQFKPVHFTGDGFVKNNVITRLLQSEVDHVQKDDRSLTTISSANYKFSYKGTNEVEERLVHVYQVKPRKKRAGLFKGRIYLDAHLGTLVRAEGTLVKSPSFFIKKIEFMQDYADIGPFTFPVHIHSEASTRLVGRAIVDIYHRDYQPASAMSQARQQAPAL